MADADLQCLLGLLKSRHPCVLISTTEESYALEVVRATAVSAGVHGLVWSVTHGLQDAVIRDGQAIADTEHPAGALTQLATHTPANSVVIFLDLCAHLTDQRTLRCFRDLVPLMQKVKSTLVLIEQLRIVESGGLALVSIEGSHFLWKMVRRLVGVLVEIGRGAMEPAAAARLLAGPSELPARLTAPPSGLFLERVYYEGDQRDELVRPAFNCGRQEK